MLIKPSFVKLFLNSLTLNRFGFLLLCIIPISFTIHAQVNIDFNIKNFPAKARELNRNIQKIESANQLFKNNEFENALNLYLQVNQFNPDNSDVNYNIALCYLSLDKPSASLKYFEYSIKLKDQILPETQYNYAKALHLSGKYAKAIYHYDAYSKQLPAGDDLQNEIVVWKQSCVFAQNSLKDSTLAVVNNMGKNINTKYPDYAPFYLRTSSQLLFNSNRQENLGNLKEKSEKKYFEDVYFSQKSSDSWKKAQNIGRKLNDRTHDGVVGISYSNYTLFIYKEDNGGDIYVKTGKLNRWENNLELNNKINSPFHESSVALTADSLHLFFVSDRTQGSKGGKDIYISHLEANQWSTPENIGITINTPKNEQCVNISPKGDTLYFSSDGHLGMGGYDIFMSVKDSLGYWIKPVNLGYPINSPLNDMYYFPVSNTEAFLSSNREGTLGDMDLYQVFITPKSKKIAKTDSNLMAKKMPIQIITANVPKIIEKQSFDSINLNFSINQYVIADSTQKELNKLADFLKDNPTKKVTVYGYTCNLGSDKKNQILSEKRAKYVAEYLTNKNVSKQQIEVAGKGKLSPLFPNDSEKNRRKNRRVEVRLK